MTTSRSSPAASTWPARIFSTKVRRNIKLAECPSFGQTIIKYDPTSNGAADYRSLAREVLAMTGEAPPASAIKPKPVVVAPVRPSAEAGVAATAAVGAG